MEFGPKKIEFGNGGQWGFLTAKYTVEFTERVKSKNASWAPQTRDLIGYRNRLRCVHLQQAGSCNVDFTGLRQIS